MKYIHITLGLLIAISGYSQNSHIEKADKLYDTYQYVAAIDEYLKLNTASKADAYVYKRLGDSYYHVYNMEEASKWYSKAIVKKQDAETYYRYAQTLKAQGKYAEANTQMDTFASLVPNDSRAKDHKANPNYIPALADKNKLFDMGQTTINSNDYIDFGAVLDNSGTVYFVSNRNTSGRTDKWVDQPYMDIYKSVRNEDGSLSEPESLSELNTPYHDGPVSVSADGNTMFFARDGHSEGDYTKDKKNRVKIGQQGLYKATKVNGKWTNETALPFNSKTFSVSHPSLSKDGKTLYFASNMPGGLGDTDIWKVSVTPSGYGKPENLGAPINTPDKEGFPFIADDGTLYFASRGHQGFGGLDVFRYDAASKTVSNLGKPVNSEKDDFAFSYNTSQSIGYISSNRAGTDNVYPLAPVCAAEVLTVIKDAETGQLLQGATVAISDNKNNVIETQQTNASGEVQYRVECQTVYVLKVSKQNYEATVYTVPETKAGKVIANISLEPSEVIITDTEVILKPIYFDFDKSNITEQGANELDKLVKVMNDHPSMVIQVKSHTDTKGSTVYNLKLSEQRAQSTVQYIISKGIFQERISGKGFGKSEPKIDCKDNCNDEQDAQNRRSEFLIVKM